MANARKNHAARRREELNKRATDRANRMRNPKGTSPYAKKVKGRRGPSVDPIWYRWGQG